MVTLRHMWPYVNLDQDENDLLVSASLDLASDLLDQYMVSTLPDQTVIYDVLWTDHAESSDSRESDIHAVPVGGGEGAPGWVLTGRTAPRSDTAGVAVAYNGIVERPDGERRGYGVTVLLRDGTLVAMQQVPGEPRYWHDRPQDLMIVAGLRRYLDMPTGDFPQATPLDALASILEQAALATIEKRLALLGDAMYSHLEAVRDDPEKMAPMLILVVGVLDEIATFEAQGLWRTGWEGIVYDVLNACDVFLRSPAATQLDPRRLAEIHEWRRFIQWVDDPMLAYLLTDARNVGPGETRAVLERMRNVAHHSRDPLAADTCLRYGAWVEYVDEANQVQA